MVGCSKPGTGSPQTRLLSYLCKNRLRRYGETALCAVCFCKSRCRGMFRAGVLIIKRYAFTDRCGNCRRGIIRRYRSGRTQRENLLPEAEFGRPTREMVTLSRFMAAVSDRQAGGNPAPRERISGVHPIRRPYPAHRGCQAECHDTIEHTETPSGPGGYGLASGQQAIIFRPACHQPGKTTGKGGYARSNKSLGGGSFGYSRGS